MSSIFLAVFSVLLISANAQDCSQGPPKVNPRECCPGACPKFMTHALAVECGLPPEMADEPGSGGPPPGGPGGPGGPPPGGPGGPGGPPSCQAVTCLLNKNNLLSADGIINRQALKTFIETQYSAEWKPAIDTILQKCNAEADANQVDDCKNRSYVHCLKRNFFQNCPATVFVSSSECTQLKAFMDKCPPPRM